MIKFMDPPLYNWLFAMAVANGFWIVMFRSPLVRHLVSHYTGEELYTQTDLENFLLGRDLWFAHNLWTCPTCQAVWTTATAILVFLVTSPIWILASPLIFLATLPFVKWTQKHLA